MADTIDQDSGLQGRSFFDRIRTVHPAYFAVVMSTGIVSLAFHGLNVSIVAMPLGLLNLVLYVALLIIFGVRLLAAPQGLVADLRNASRRWGFLTIIVGTNTVGVQLLVFFHATAVAMGLWLATAIGCPVLLYYLFGAWFVGPQSDTDVTTAVDGTTLLATVSLQSLAVLGAHLNGVYHADWLLLGSLLYWAAGFVIYLVIITLVVYRLFKTGLEPAEWAGPYWICMGATAITTLAGATLVTNLSTLSAWSEVSVGVLSTTVLAWAFGTWWIPLLLALDVWKFWNHGIEGDRPTWVTLVPWLRLGFGNAENEYGPAAWGRVFPMGMYTACTLALSGIQPFGPLAAIPQVWGWFALFVWGVTFLGLLRTTIDAFTAEERITGQSPH